MTANGPDPNAAPPEPGNGPSADSPERGQEKAADWRDRIGRQVPAVLGGLGLSGPETPVISKGGAYEVGSEEFRKVCAILEDGTVCVVRAYNTAAIAGELAELRARYNLPPELAIRPVSLAKIAASYGHAVQAVVSHSPTAGQLRFQRILAEAADMGASDVKLVQEQDHGLVRIKAGGGEFTHGSQWQAEEMKQAVSWMYGVRDGGDGKASMVEGDPAAFSIGQAARVPGMPPGIAAFRGQLAWHGDVRPFLTLRLLPKADAAHQADLPGLGLDEDILDALAEERRSEAGLVIVAGSTGDGKSTTLVRNLGRLYEERGGTISICTIEDPIEYPLLGDGIIQLPVKPGRTPKERRANYSQMLMVFVRINPDVGMVSEIRSPDDVNEILHFVTSGHKVYTTVHADSANGVLFRLVSLGVRPEELSGPGVVNLVMRQKLVPALCRHCAEPLTGPAFARVEEWLGQDALLEASGPLGRIEPLRRNQAGCERCLAPYAGLSGAPAETALAAWAGYSGRRATAEFIRMDNDYREFLPARDALGARKHWLTPKKDGGMGGIPLGTRLRRLVASGIADFEHVTNEELPRPVPAITGPVTPTAADVQKDSEAGA